ncbi:MAG: SMC-Scp complex subunit ScpB, partial [Planctomycetes bacterium]|nr:SMC-Scp complex subunit ScpB [Planctomycetota bacterium]
MEDRTPEPPAAENEPEPASETIEPIDIAEEPAPEEGGPAIDVSGAAEQEAAIEIAVTIAGPEAQEVSETEPDPAMTTAPEGQVRDDTTPLTRGEQEIDRVIGVLLGEPQEEDEGQKTQEPTEARAAEATAEQPQADAPMQEAPAEGESPAAASPDETPTIESVLEAILFATDEPLTDGKLAGIVETTTKQVRESIESLNARYAAEKHAFRIEQIAGGYQMLTLNLYNSWLKKMLRARSDNKLSPAAMETLAIIAYKQPIIRADIEAIRGVAVGEVIRSLMYKGLVKIAGRAEILGRPMLYGTTKKFLEIFGLNSLKDLPKV